MIAQHITSCNQKEINKVDWNKRMKQKKKEVKVNLTQSEK